MTTVATSLKDEVIAALATVMDPELDEPITQLGFVRSIRFEGSGIEVHLRLPTSFCSPNFAYLMAADSQDALRRIHGIGRVLVQLDDHHDSDKINAGLAAEAGYRGTFGAEAEDSLDELRLTFQRKAHTAAMERCVERLLATSAWTLEELDWLTLADLRGSVFKEALLRRRLDIGLGISATDRVLVDEHGVTIPKEQIPMRLRFAKVVRISIEGNSHFCRGLLATRYADEELGGLATRVTNSEMSA
jgi:metal-sulfur cluster biosynthetic enzyme